MNTSRTKNTFEQVCSKLTTQVPFCRMHKILLLLDEQKKYTKTQRLYITKFTNRLRIDAAKKTKCMYIYYVIDLTSLS
jgi:hypothetical protein